MAKPRNRIHHGAEGAVRRDGLLHSRPRRLHYRSRPKQAGLCIRLERDPEKHESECPAAGKQNAASVVTYLLNVCFQKIALSRLFTFHALFNEPSTESGPGPPMHNAMRPAR